MNPLQQLNSVGQSVWLDFVSRDLIGSGELARRISQDGVRGLTSNPSIFAEAIGKSTSYDAQIRDELRARPGLSASELFERLAIEDIRAAADALRTVYESSGGEDGYVSLEVSPRLANDTAGTLAEARRLWSEVDRPNLMIKVPATEAGMPAVESLVSEGINVNVTLIFSLAQYEASALAYVRGIERCTARVRPASVASFFISRLDGVVDRWLRGLGTPEAPALLGRAAVANARVAYERFGLIFDKIASGLVEAGARPQRPLWASTSTKDPAYSDVLYVEGLIARDTVNTMPLVTMDAWKDHGVARVTITPEAIADAHRTLDQLARLGLDLDGVTAGLLHDGVEKFAKSYDDLLASLSGKRASLLA